MSIIKKCIRYVQESKLEAKRITWPEKHYVLTTSGIVCVVVLLCSLFCLLIDFCISKAVGFLLMM